MEMEQWDTGMNSFQEISNVNAVQYDGDSSYHHNQHDDPYRNDNNNQHNNYPSNNRNYSMNNNRNYHYPQRRNQQNHNNYRRNNDYRRQQYNNNQYNNNQYNNNNNNNNNSHYGGYGGNSNRTRYQPRNKQHNYQQYQPKYQAKHNTQQHAHTHDIEAQSNEASSNPPNTTSSTPYRPVHRFGKKKKFKRQIEDDLNYEEADDPNAISTSNNIQHESTTQYIDESEAQIGHNNRYDTLQNKTSSFPSYHSNHTKPKTNTLDLENLSQRAKEMALQLKNSSYDCMVCQSFIGKKGRIWKCQHCYTMFHMTCVNKWARAREEKDAETEERALKPNHLIDKIRCPACNYMDTEFKFDEYKCFCGKVIFDHEYRSSYNYASGIPHSCGDICAKKRGTHCPHSCRSECHPGPCIPCNLPSNRTSKCACGKLEYSLLCGQTETKQRLCKQICDTILKCGNHRCLQECHYGECKQCDVKTKQECFCGKHKTLKPCGTGVAVTLSVANAMDDEEKGKKEVIIYKYSCAKVCNKALSCTHHRCTLTCHNGSCSVCPRRIETPTRCACTKSTFDIERISCLDALPVCNKSCGRMLSCGQHFCRKTCHDCKCTLCTVQIKRKCRCGAADKKYKCHDYEKKVKQFVSGANGLVVIDRDEWIKCGKKCKRVKSCGKHTCAEICCSGRSIRTFYEGHRCRELCNKALECGRHRCSSYCHRGNCNPCGVTYRNGVECACGAVFVPGPFQCGTKRIPQCNQTCDKVLPCCHSCAAKCHDGDCAPCIRICSKPCHSHGLMVHNMPCHVDHRSCGNSCGILLDCGVHPCMRTCHNGVCMETSSMTQNKGCGQICGQIFKQCGHKCMRKCHANSHCNSDHCKAQIRVKCKCGNTSEKQYCKGRTEYELRAVPCSEECQIAIRNARFREALNINATKKKSSNDEDMMIPYAASVLDRILKWMNDDSRHPHILKNNEKIIAPKFVYYMEGLLDAYISDKSDDGNVFRSQYMDVTVLVSSSKKEGIILNLKPMSSEQRYIVYCMSTHYHIRSEKRENSGKYGLSYLELSKTGHSRIADYLLSKALIEYQVHRDEIKTLESMPPSHIIVIDAATQVSSSLIQDRLLAWTGDYRMFKHHNDEMFIVFTDQDGRNSAMTQLHTFGARKATASDAFSANTAAAHKKNQQRKKKLKAQHQSQLHQERKSKSNTGWSTVGNAHAVSSDSMTKYKPETFHVKMNNRFG